MTVMMMNNSGIGGFGGDGGLGNGSRTLKGQQRQRIGSADGG